MNVLRPFCERVRDDDVNARARVHVPGPWLVRVHLLPGDRVLGVTTALGPSSPRALADGEARVLQPAAQHEDAPPRRISPVGDAGQRPAPLAGPIVEFELAGTLQDSASAGEDAQRRLLTAQVCVRSA